MLVEVELFDQRATSLPIGVGHHLVLFGFRPRCLGLLLVMGRELLVVGRCFSRADHVGHAHAVLCERAHLGQTEGRDQRQNQWAQNQSRLLHPSLPSSVVGAGPS